MLIFRSAILDFRKVVNRSIHHEDYFLVRSNFSFDDFVTSFKIEK